MSPLAASRTYLLPWPPSVNKALTVSRGRKVLSPKTRKWQNLAAEELSLQKPEPVKSPAWITIVLYPQDKRRFDIDNKVKSVLDALVAAKVIEDDCCRDLMSIVVNLGEIVPEARALVVVGHHRWGPAQWPSEIPNTI